MVMVMKTTSMVNGDKDDDNDNQINIYSWTSHWDGAKICAWGELLKGTLMAMITDHIYIDEWHWSLIIVHECQGMLWKSLTMVVLLLLSGRLQMIVFPIMNFDRLSISVNDELLQKLIINDYRLSKHLKGRLEPVCVTFFPRIPIRSFRTTCVWRFSLGYQPGHSGPHVGDVFPSDTNQIIQDHMLVTFFPRIRLS